MLRHLTSHHLTESAQPSCELPNASCEAHVKKAKTHVDQPYATIDSGKSLYHIRRLLSETAAAARPLNSALHPCSALDICRQAG